MAGNTHDTASLELFLYCGLTEAHQDSKTGTTPREKCIHTKNPQLR